MSTADPAIQARVMHALGEAAGPLPRAEAAAALPASERPRLDAAIAALTGSELVALGADGALRPGRRGSLLSAARVRRLRRGGRYGANPCVLAAVGSTNDAVLQRAATGAPPGTVVAAELQTAGRGTKGRSFRSPPGLGVWSSTLLDAPPDPAAAPRTSLVAALAVAAAVERVTGVRPGVKWPNDVRLGGRKVCGVLVEARTIAGTLFLVAGIGVNVHHLPAEFPPELRELAGSLEDRTGARVDRSELLAELLRELEDLTAADREGELDLAGAYARVDELFGRDVEVRAGDGTFSGRADGIESDGCLRVRRRDGTVRAVRSAEVSAGVRTREPVGRGG